MAIDSQEKHQCDVPDILRRGGRGRIDLLEHCVLSVNTDSLFLYLVGEYRMRPQANAATTLFDLFCSHDAPARLSVTTLLPPKDRRLQHQVDAFRPSPIVDASEAEPVATPLIQLPPKYLFDEVTRQIEHDTQSPWHKLNANYDPDKTPHENLDGGALTARQRQFVDYVWTPRVRPQLVAAGFWTVAAIA